MAHVDDVVTKMTWLCNKVYPSFETVRSFNDTADKFKADSSSFSLGTDMYTTDGVATCTDADIYMTLWDMANQSRKNKRSDTQAMLDVMLLRWIPNKIVYSFDVDVEASFSRMDWHSLCDVTVDVLDRLPVDCFVISFNRTFVLSGTEYDFCCIMNDVRYVIQDDKSCKRMKSSGLHYIFLNSKTLEMRPVLMSNIEKTAGFDMTFASLYDANATEFYPKSKDIYRNILTFILPYVFYLCSQNAEIDQSEFNKMIYRPSLFASKHRIRHVKQMVCGQPTGMRIRAFKKQQYEHHEGGIGSVRAPHVRRAHYHTYWVGTGDNRHKDIRWMPPIYIHADLKNYIQPVNAKVKRSYK